MTSCNSQKICTADMATGICESDGSEERRNGLYRGGGHNCVRRHAALGNVARIVFEQQAAKFPIVVSEIT